MPATRRRSMAEFLQQQRELVPLEVGDREEVPHA